MSDPLFVEITPEIRGWCVRSQGPGPGTVTPDLGSALDRALGLAGDAPVWIAVHAAGPGCVIQPEAISKAA